MRSNKYLLVFSLLALILPSVISVVDENGKEWGVIFGKREKGDDIMYPQNFPTVKDTLASGKTVYTKIINVGPQNIITQIKARFKASDQASVKIVDVKGAGPSSFTYIFFLKSQTKGRIQPEIKVYGKRNPKLSQHVKPELKRP